MHYNYYYYGIEEKGVGEIEGEWENGEGGV